MPSRGAQSLLFGASERQHSMLDEQMTDVQKPLIGAPRICDAGQRVVLTSSGGYIQKEVSGQTNAFHRGNSVYRLAVDAVNPKTWGFTRQGK